MKRLSLFLLGCLGMLPCIASDTVTIVMNPLADVEITAPVKQATAHSQTLDKSQLAKHNQGQNLPYLISQTPSVTVSSDDGLGIGYTYFRVRGTDHGRIAVSINDVPLNEPESQTVYFVDLPDLATGVESVDIQRGVGNSTNGGSDFGAGINMQTHTHDSVSKFSVGFNGGMYRTFREQVSASIALPHRWYATARFSKINSDGYLERAASDLYSYAGSIGYFSPKTQAYAEVLGGDETTYMAWNGVSRAELDSCRRYNPAGKYIDDEGNTAYYPNQHDKYAQQHAQLHWNQRWTSNWHTVLTLHYRHGQGYYEQYRTDFEHLASDYVCRQQMENHFFGAIAQFKYIHEQAELQAGGAAHGYVGDEWGNILWTRDKEQASIASFFPEYYRNQGRKTDANAFARANWFVIRQSLQSLTLFADLQYRYVRYALTGTAETTGSDSLAVLRNYHFFNPKAGLTYERHRHRLAANFAMSNREPVKTNFTESGAQEVPLPERLLDYELGYLYQGSWGGRQLPWHAGVNFYGMDYYNQLVLTGKLSAITDAKLTMNVPRSYRVGIECEWAIDWTPWFRWEANVTLSRNRIIDHTEWVDIAGTGQQVQVHLGDVPIAMSPSWLANNRFLFHTHGFSATVHTQAVGKQYLDNTMNEEATLKPYCVTNLLLDYSLRLPKTGGTITFLCTVNNVFNTSYESNGGNYTCILAPLPSNQSPLTTSKLPLTASPWYYAQAGINVHAGFRIDW